MMDEQPPPAQPPQPMPQAPYPPQQPQVVYVPVPTNKSVPWSYLAVTAAGILALVGFFFLPYESALDVSFTGVQMALDVGGSQILWVVAAAGASAVIIGGLGAASRPTPLQERRAIGGTIVLVGIASAWALYQFYAALASEFSPAFNAASLLAAGFWLCVLADVELFFIGGIAVLAEG